MDFIREGRAPARPRWDAITGGSQLVATAGVDLETNSVAKLASLSLDVAAPADALSATVGDANQDGIADLLVSDSEGRIWYYRGNREQETGNRGQETGNRERGREDDEGL